MDRIKVFALGGLDENGRDCYVVEINDDIFVLDAGLSLPDKSIPGVDCLLPNFDYLIKNKDRIRAYIMTHGHDESVGALKFLYKFAPAKIYTTSTTRSVMNAQLIIHHHNDIVFDYVIVNPSDEKIVAGRKVRFFQTCHNAANSFGVAINTDQGNIIYTSDFMINFATGEEDHFKFDLYAASELAKEPTLLLMAESKSASKNGYCSPKHRMNNLVEKYFKANKKIFITCYWQNMYRIREIVRLCKKYKKKLFYYDDYTEKVMNYVMINDGLISLGENDVVKREDLLRVKSSDLVILILGHSDDIFKEMTAISNHSNYDPRIRIEKDDIFINSAVPRAIFETRATRSIDDVYRTGCEVVWLKSKNISPMHACEDDLRFILNMFRPKYYLPVRGYYTDMIKNAKHAVALGIGLNYMNVFVLDNGMQIVFENGKKPAILTPEITGIDLAPVLVDGMGVAKLNDEIISVRQKMAIDGTVVIASTVSIENKCIIAGPDCQMRGFVYAKNAEPLLKSISQIYVEEVMAALNKGITDFTATKSMICERTKRFLKRDTGREPFIEPIIIIK